MESANSFLTITGKLSIMIGTLLYVFNSNERHSKPTKETYGNFRTISHNFFPQLLTPRFKQGMQLIYGFFFFIQRASHPRLFLTSFQLTSKRGAVVQTCLCSVLFISKVSQKFVSIFKHIVE